VTCAPHELVAAGIGKQTCKSDGIWPNEQVVTRAVPIPRALRQTDRAPKTKAPKSTLRQRLEKVGDAWNDFQTTRTRDAVYKYLSIVFETVMHYKVRRRMKKLMRQAFEFADIPFDENADPFTAVIRCTSADGADSKTISKWARALRYAAHCKVPRTRLKTFMKQVGGVNACADRYTRYCGRRTR
jgi:hypothetical protein